MSCYNWERGTIVVPKGQWAKFRTDLLRKWNAHLEKEYEFVLGAFASAKAAAKGKRGKNRQESVMTSLATSCGGEFKHGRFMVSESQSIYVASNADSKFARWDLVSTHCMNGQRGDDFGLSKTQPKKKDFEFLKLTKGVTIQGRDANVTFFNSDHKIQWTVHENNRAVARAREWWFAKALFAALDRIRFTRGTGGEIFGNDEYNRDSDYADGGGNYVTSTYSSEKTSKAVHRWA